MKKRKKLGRKLLSFLLTLALVLGLMPRMSLTVYADGAYTIKAYDNDYLYLDYGDFAVVDSLPYATTAKDLMKQVGNNSLGSKYNMTGVTLVSGSSVTIGAVTGTSGNSDYNVDISITGEGESVIQVTATNGWGPYNIKIVTTSPHSVTLTGGANATPSGGDTSQTGLSGAMTTVTYTANDNYNFPETSDYYKTTNGITVARTSDTVVTVSGTPTADTTVTVPGALAIISQTVTFKVVNGKWDDGSTKDKTVTLSGLEGDTLKLAADQIPAVGTKPNDTYKAGSWDVTPSADTEITAATTYTYTYAAKEASVVTKVPEAKTLTYTGFAQELVTAGEATGGTMQYALGTDDKTAPEDGWDKNIPKMDEAGTYYVWYKVVGNENYNDSKADVVTVTIKPTVTVTFDSNGGSEVDSQVIDKGSKAEEPEEPTNGKLTFIGWFIDPTIENLYDFDNDKINSFDFSSAIEKDTKLTAVWTAFARVNTIGTGKVNFAYEGEEKDDEYDDSIILSAIQGMADTFILTAKADEGSRFVKWQKVIEEGETVEDSTFEDYSEDEEITIKITEPISLVAVFEAVDVDDKEYSSYESDSEWTKGSGKTLKVGAKGSEDDEETINHFTGIKCNGKEIAKKYYTAKKGSVIIEIDPEYLETLEAGKHVLTLMFDDADDLDIEFTVLAAEEDDSKDDTSKDNTSKDAKIDVDTDTADTGKTTGSNTDSSAQTGDNTQILLALFIMIDSALALNYLMIKKRKSRKN